MRIRFSFYPIFVAILPIWTAQASEVTDFCSDLENAGLAKNWASQSIFYRDAKGKPAQLLSYDEISKSRIDTFYYYINSKPSEYGRKSVLNLKFVYKSNRESRRKDFVDLRNDRWVRLSERKKRRILNDCAHVNVEGYDRFHLQNSRDYCLQYHFHQSAPNFETLATAQRRESFSFGDMVGEPPPGLGALFISLLGPGPAAAAAAQNELSTAPYSQVRSWIQNFQHGNKPDLCIAIEPDFPQDATFVDVRVNYLGTTASDSIGIRNWHLKLSE